MREHFKEPLVHALRDISEKKPQDPVEYLGFWLRNYRSVEEKMRRQREFEKDLRTRRISPIPLSDSVMTVYYRRIARLHNFKRGRGCVGIFLIFLIARIPSPRYPATLESFVPRDVFRRPSNTTSRNSQRATKGAETPMRISEIITPPLQLTSLLVLPTLICTPRHKYTHKCVGMNANMRSRNVPHIVTRILCAIYMDF